MRIYVDTTYTRHQRQAIGITRVVRRLFDEINAQGKPRGDECLAVTYHPGGYRLADGPGAGPSTDVKAAGLGADGRPSVGEPSVSLYGALREVVAFLLKVVPWPLLAPFWVLASNALEAARSRGCKPVRFHPGDMLLIADVAWGYASWRAATLAKSQGAQVVTIVYDLMPIRQPQYCYALVPKVYGLRLRRMARLSDHLMCISKATADDVTNWMAESGLPKEQCSKIRIFSLGSDFQAQAVQGHVRPAITQHFAKGAPCFAMIGTFEPKKNYELVWQVFCDLWARGNKVHLALVGRQTEEMAWFIEGMERHPGAQDHLLLVHDATDAEVQYVYNHARALIMASKFEGYGLPLVEARARGCPVIASNIPSFVELKDGGVWIFDLAVPAQLEDLVLEHASQDQHAFAGVAEVPSWRDSATAILNLARRD